MKVAPDEYTFSPLWEIPLSQQSEGAPLNKVTRPLTTGVVDRERLFSRIDEARLRPVLWVAAPGGSGKTTLVASYLESRLLPTLWYQVDGGDTDIATFFHFMEIAAIKAMPAAGPPLLRLTPDQFLAIQTFSRRWFESLFAHLPRLCTVVFDNFQDAHGPLFHNVLYEGLDAVPPGITVIVVSREPPPERFARLLANGRIELLGWEQVRFTLEEATEFIKTRSTDGTPAETVQRLYHKTEGWIAGLLLIMEHARLQGHELSTEGCWTTEGIFNYFAAEVLAGMNQERQAFLLATSLLPYVPASLAEALTGYRHAGRILADMSRGNYFTSRRTGLEAVYQYHQLFQAFLQSKAEEQFGREDMRQLRANAARLFAEAGDAAAAVDLYRKAEAWQEAAALICQHAPVFLVQGRSETVREWLSELPGKMVEADAGLLYWYGASLISTNPWESQDRFRKAFSLYRQAGDRAGTLLSWSGATDANFYTAEFFRLKEWYGVLSELLAEDSSFPTHAVETRVTMSAFNAMSFTMTDHPDIRFWQEKAYGLVNNDDSVEINQRLMTCEQLRIYYCWGGNFARAAVLSDLIHALVLREDVSDLAKLASMSGDVVYCFLIGRFDDGLRLTEEAMQLVDRCGISAFTVQVLGHAISCALSKGDLATADRLLERMSGQLNSMQRIEVVVYQVGVAWKAMLENDFPLALQYGKLLTEGLGAIGHLSGEGIAFTGMAEVLWELGNEDEARQMLARGYERAELIASPLLEFFCRLVDAWMVFAKGGDAIGVERLGRAFLLARVNGYVNKYFWRPSVMSDLCARALEAGIETEYVRRLIWLRNLTEYPPSVEIEAWPWPVKVYTLGRFELQIDGEPVSFSGKIQKKPLEMLKAMVALGGGEAREGQIAGFLWPDADGDTAKSSLKVTLHRLRDLLGDDRAVQVREGRISLDQNLVWTDVRAFDHFLRSAQLKGDAGDEAEAVRLTEKALALYRGQLLDDEGDKPWLVSARKRLKSRFVLHVVALGNLWLQRGDHKRAIACYLRGLEVDDLAEELYQSLMECYLAAGLKGEAASVYERCRRNLAFHGVKPSARTMVIYRTVLA